MVDHILLSDLFDMLLFSARLRNEPDQQLIKWRSQHIDIPDKYVFIFRNYINKNDFAIF